MNFPPVFYLTFTLVLFFMNASAYVAQNKSEIVPEPPQKSENSDKEEMEELMDNLGTLIEKDHRRKRRVTADRLLGREIRDVSSSLELTPEEVIELLALYVNRNRQLERDRWPVEENKEDEEYANDINDAMLMEEALRQSRLRRIPIIRRDVL